MSAMSQWSIASIKGSALIMNTVQRSCLGLLAPHVNPLGLAELNQGFVQALWCASSV